MARPALATLEELEAALGVSVSKPTQAQSLLERASAIVRAFAQETWLDDGGELENVPDDVPGVVVGMVERATRNADGVTQESTGPFARSYGPDAAHRLYLSAMDKLVLRSAVGSTGLSTISTTRGRLETADVSDDWGWGELPEEVVW